MGHFHPRSVRPVLSQYDVGASCARGDMWVALLGEEPMAEKEDLLACLREQRDAVIVKLEGVPVEQEGDLAVALRRRPASATAHARRAIGRSTHRR
jgi:hypothetical protein